MRRWRRRCSATGILLVTVLATAGCTSAGVIEPTSTGRTTAVVSTPLASPSASPIPTYPAAPKAAARAGAEAVRRAFGSGCSSSTAKEPSTRFTATIGDVDGDGRDDTEWATIPVGGMLEFGVTTAAGVTIAKSVGFASGGGRMVSIGTLATGQTVALPTDGHSSLVFVLRDCRWIEPRSTSGAGGTDFLTGYYDPPEDGGGCVGRRLYQVDEVETSKDHRTFTGITEHLSSDGRTMTAGKQVTFLANAGPDSTPYPGEEYGGGLCQGSKLLQPEYRG